MYLILMDHSYTYSYYMKPGKFEFYAFSNKENVKLIPPEAVLVETEYEDEKELFTKLFNAGFKKGYLDGKEVILNSRNNIYYYDPCINELAYAQYLLTKDQKYLNNLIVKEKLLTVCQIEEKTNTILFPTVQLADGTLAVLCYTDLKRIPKDMFEKYIGYRIVRMSFNTSCVVNDSFIAE